MASCSGKRWNRPDIWRCPQKLNRVLIKYRDSPKYELRDLTTGKTLVQGNNVIEYAFMDEWHRRIYVSTGKWNGVIGNWTIELDAATGQELNAWGLETYGVMCRMKDSDTCGCLSTSSAAAGDRA